MATLPTELIIDIFSRLPVKTLLRFKCVLKPCGSLIENSEFTQLHLHQSFKAKTNLKLLLRSTRFDEAFISRFDEAFSVDFDSLDNLAELGPLPFYPTGIDTCTRVFGSCNGLVAVYHESHESWIALWNPSTRDVHYLPNLTVWNTVDYYFLGFGYDMVSNDYKVVILMSYGRNVMVYSLKTNSWKRIRNCPCKLARRRNWGHLNSGQDGAYVNGSLHWAGDNSIIGLDLGVEEYRLIPVCEEAYNRNAIYTNVVGVLGGSLCVFGRKWDEDLPMDHNLGLWIMKEYGVKESWTQLIQYDLCYFHLDTYLPKAIAYSRSGNKILLDGGGFNEAAWCNPEEVKFERVYIPGTTGLGFRAERAYVESLVSVMPPNHL